MKYNFITPNSDTIKITIYHLKENSQFEYEQQPIYAKASFVGQKQIKNYRIAQGVEGSDRSMYLRIMNLQEEIKVGDKVVVMGEEKVVQSVGYFYEDTRLINKGIFSVEYLNARSPKGIALD